MSGGEFVGGDGGIGDMPAGTGEIPARNTPERDDVLAMRHICTSPGCIVTFGITRPLMEIGGWPPEPANRLGTVPSSLITITG